MSSLSSLVVDLQLNSAKLRAGLDQANAQLESFSKRLDKIGKVVSLSMGADIAKDAIAGLANFVQHGAEAADQMGKLAQSAGVPVEELSRLAYAAEFSGVSADELGATLGRLSMQMAEAAAGGKDQSALFQALGISIKDSSGNLRDAGSVMGDIAERFATLKDGSAKAALAQELFGKSGAQLIPLLNSGKEGLAEMAAEADRFGLTVTSAAAESANEFGDNLDRLKKACEGVAIRVAANLTPSLTKLTNELLSSKDGASALDTAAKALAGTLRVLASAGAIIAGLFEVIGKSIGAVAAATVEVARGNLKEAFEIVKLGATDVVGAVQGAKDRIMAIWSDAPSAAAKSVEDAHEKEQEAADKLLAKLQRVKRAQEDVAAAAKRAAEEAKRAAEERKALFERFAGIETESASKMRDIDLEVANRRAAFGTIGNEQASFAQRTAGFADFDDALQKYASYLKRHEEALADVKALEAMKDLETARLAQENADALKALAERANDAAKAFEDQQAAMVEAHRAELQRVADARGAMAERFVGSLGDLSSLIQSGMQGAAAGGPWGAVGGVIADLLTRSESFAEILDMIGKVIQVAADGVGLLIRPFLTLVAAVMPLVEAVGALLEPFSMFYETIISQFVPILVVVGALLKSLAPIMKVVATVLAIVVQVFMVAFLPGLELLFEILRLAAYGITKMMMLFAPIWNGFIDAIRGFLRNIAEFQISVFGWTIKPFAALGGLADSLGHATINVDELATQLQELEGLTWDEARAKAENLSATEDATAATKQFAEALRNVPNGFKYALAKYDSANVSSGDATVGRPNLPHLARGGIVDRPTVALIGEGSRPEIVAPDNKLRAIFREELAGGRGGVIININGITDPRAVANKVLEVLRQLNFRATGTPVMGAPRFAGG